MLNRHLNDLADNLHVRWKSYPRKNPMELSDDGTYQVYGRSGDYETYGPIYGKGSTLFHFFHF